MREPPHVEDVSLLHSKLLDRAYFYSSNNKARQLQKPIPPLWSTLLYGQSFYRGHATFCMVEGFIHRPSYILCYHSVIKGIKHNSRTSFIVLEMIRSQFFWYKILNRINSMTRPSHFFIARHNCLGRYAGNSLPL